MPAPGGSRRAGAFILSTDLTGPGREGPVGPLELAHDWRTVPLAPFRSQISWACWLSEPAAINLIEHSTRLPIEPLVELANRHEHPPAPTHYS